MKNKQINKSILFYLFPFLLVNELNSMSLAAGSYGIRVISSNTLYECKGLLLEIKLDVGNVFSARSEVTIICMESLNKAEWVLKAAAQCSLDAPPTCIDGKLELSLKESVEYKYIDDINIRSTKPHLYQAQKSVLGNDCNAIQFNQYNYWKCNNYTDLQNLSFSTTGDTKLIYLGEFYDNFYDFISPYLSDIPFDFIDVFKKRYTATP